MIDFHFDDIIKVVGLDPDGKMYDKVSRVEARSEESDIHLQLDVNSQLYPIRAGQKFRMILSRTLNLDGSVVTEYIPEGKQKTLADKFEYVMQGLLYKITEESSGGAPKMVVTMSFGGLQLVLKGDPSKMGKFKVDQRLFLLLRKM